MLNKVQSAKDKEQRVTKNNVSLIASHVSRDGGQSLVEVVLAVAVAVIIIVALVGVTVMAIRNADFARKKALATEYAQEGMEEIRQMRDENPATFFDDPCPSSEEVGGIFFKEITCADPTPDKREVTINVYWEDSRGKHETILVSVLTKWR